ncbi:protein DEHYDRATION-INDUCED 19 homolog 4 isoform X2 [Cajanus cajan]|uniref:protein DEHYDRATION-INDUCED 19 homolog 4 isoform X2 n=1 Tax=Cajanus cajan TaxID=3821 RepID=UPI00098DC9DA|nr:protein DEHYDRATION-INDUCED 19 homolog 4 isoform X2 [Cajanus cajan]
MDSNSWRLSAPSRRYHSRSDLLVEEIEGGDDYRSEFLCPFCAEDYDVVSLCCHIDDHHPIQAKNGVCPICGKVGGDLVGHVTTQHGNFLRVQRKRRVRKGGSTSPISMLKKELREGALHSILGGSSHIVPSASEPDPLLSLFMFNHVVADESVSVPSCPSIENAPVKERSSKDDFLERKPQQLQMSEEDKVEKARRFDFVQGLLMSTIVDGDVL